MNGIQFFIYAHLTYCRFIAQILLTHIHILRCAIPAVLHANDNDDDEISTSTRGLCILYITLIARKLSKPDDDRYRPKHVVFYC